jgi:hypothetical protein
MSNTSERVVTKVGGVVISRVCDDDRVPLSCPVCDILFCEVADMLSYRKYSCCSRCATYWAERDPVTWQAGKRPTTAEVDSRILRL